MSIEVSIGNYDVIGTGSVVGNHEEPIQFAISPLTFIFEFRNDSADAATRSHRELVNDTTLKIILFNFTSSLGIRNTSPLSLGTLGDRKLLMNFSVYSLSDNVGKLFHYTFLLEKEVSHE